MSQVNSVGSVNFQDYGKYSAYDIERMKNIVAYTVSGNGEKAREAFDEFSKDKKMDKARNVIVSAITLVAAITSGKNLLKLLNKDGKVAGIAKKVLKFGVEAVDSLIDIVTKTENGKGKKAFTNLLQQDIKIGPKAKNGVKKAVDFFVRDAERNKNAKKALGEFAQNFSEKTGIKKYKDIACLGLAAGVGSTVDEPINKVLDKADDGKDMNARLDEINQD